MKRALNRLANWCEGYVNFVYLLSIALATGVMDATFGQGKMRRRAERGQVDTIIAVVVLGVLAIIGIVVYARIEGAIPLDVDQGLNDPDNASRLENASASLNDGFGNAMDLLPVVMIVLVAALVIGVIQRFRQ